MSFPSVDPIPIPAPIWLIKLLSDVTLALHFCAVMILIGSLVLIGILDASARKKRDNDQLSAAYILARRLPVIMTYVVNLGIPPLLFAQVLYGRALYTSSILIAITWLSVIGLVMLAYWLLYQIAPAIEARKLGWPIAGVALLIVAGIGHIYSANMTLMLRPEVWQQMYAHSPRGLQDASGDPTSAPRWLFILCGGIVFGGLWALVLSNMGHITDSTKSRLRRSGGLLTPVGVVLQIWCAVMVFRTQPEAVRLGLSTNALYSISGIVCLASLIAAALAAAYQYAAGKSNPYIAASGLVAGFVGIAGSVVYRDGIRDLTLMQKGFNVWDRAVYANWSVVGLFLLLFVVMIGVIVWLVSVMRQATPPIEQVSV